MPFGVQILHGSTRAFNSLVLNYQSSSTIGGFHLPQADFIRSANFICQKANLFASLLALHGWYPKAVLSVLHQPTALCAVQIQGTCSNEIILAQQNGNVNSLKTKTFDKSIYFFRKMCQNIIAKQIRSFVLMLITFWGYNILFAKQISNIVIGKKQNTSIFVLRYLLVNQQICLATIGVRFFRCGNFGCRTLLFIEKLI